MSDKIQEQDYIIVFAGGNILASVKFCNDDNTRFDLFINGMRINHTPFYASAFIVYDVNWLILV